MIGWFAVIDPHSSPIHQENQKSFAVGSKMAAANNKISATFKSNFKGKKSKEFVQKLIKTTIQWVND